MSMIGFALFAAATSAQINVSSATGDWSDIPPVSSRGMMQGVGVVLSRLERIGRSRECTLPGMSRRHTSLNVPFLVQFDPSGAVKEIVVQKLDCPAAEEVIGTELAVRARRGAFRPTGANDAGWYRGAYTVESTTN
jgi:hypothetical protein